MFWKLKPPISEEFISQFPEYSPLILQLLWDRGLKTQEAIDEFFSPDYDEDLHDPFLMLGMKEAVKRILQAVKKKEKILIYGDYDCDGVCSAIILESVLRQLGAEEISVYLPDRNGEGYGLNNEAVQKIVQQKVNLIITVDCGVRDVEEIKKINSLNMEVVVLDHHEVGSELPPARAIVDPFQKNEQYPFRELAAAGVVFKVVQALIRKSGQQIKAGWEKWLLDLVALATVADCVPLLGENRTLVRYGLIVLAQTQRLGLQELMKIARLNPTLERESLKTNLDAYSLGFVLAPRLNAAGRLESARVAYDLLNTQDREQARELAQKIDAQNRQRQKITEEIVAAAEQRLKEDEENSRWVIIEGDKKWPPGLLGLAAGKLTDRYNRPTFIFHLADDFSRASTRSIPNFNIVKAMAQCAELLKEYGGHASAAGLELKTKNYEAFKQKIRSVARQALQPEDLISSIEIDFELPPEEISWKLFDSLEKFKPFGQGNKAPKFLTKNLIVKNCRLVGNGSKHLKLDLTFEEMTDKVFKAIGFGLAADNSGLKIGDKIDAVFELLIDEWNGNRELQMKIIDIKKV